MAHAVTHVLLVIIIVDIFRDYVVKKKFSLYYVYLAGFFALVPDIDLPIGALLGLKLHGTFTHWIYWPLLAFLLASIFFGYYNSKIRNKDKLSKKYGKYHRYGMVSLFIGIGLISHLILDCAFGGYQFFFPLAFNYCPQLFNEQAAVWTDAVLLLGWLGWEWRKHNIKDFV